MKPVAQTFINIRIKIRDECDNSMALDVQFLVHPPLKLLAINRMSLWLIHRLREYYETS